MQKDMTVVLLCRTCVYFVIQRHHTNLKYYYGFTSINQNNGIIKYALTSKNIMLQNGGIVPGKGSQVKLDRVMVVWSHDWTLSQTAVWRVR